MALLEITIDPTRSVADANRVKAAIREVGLAAITMQEAIQKAFRSTGTNTAVLVRAINNVSNAYDGVGARVAQQAENIIRVNNLLRNNFTRVFGDARQTLSLVGDEAKLLNLSLNQIKLSRTGPGSLAAAAREGTAAFRTFQSVSVRAVNRLTRAVRTFRRDINEVNKTGFAIDVGVRNIRQLNTLAARFRVIVRLIDRITEATRRLRTEGVNTFSLLANEVARLTNPLKTSAQAMTTLRQNARGAGNALRRTGESANNTASILTRLVRGVRAVGSALLVLNVARRVFRGITNEISRTFNTLRDFQLSLNTIQAVSGATGARLQEVQDTILEFSRTTQFTATEAAAGFEELTRAGQTAEQAISLLPTTLNLAAAGLLSVKESADIATNVLAQFNLETNDFARAADVIATVANNSNTTVRQLGQGLKFVGPAAASAGVSLEETSVILGAFATAGVKAGAGGRAFRRLLSNLATDTPKVRASLERLGLSLEGVRATLRDRGAIAAVRELANANLDLESANALVGQRQGSFIVGLTNQINTIDRLNNEVNNATGAVDRFAAVIQQDLPGALRRLQSELEATRIEAGRESGLQASLVELLETTRGAVQDSIPALTNAFATLSDVIDLITSQIPQLAEEFQRLVVFFSSAGNVLTQPFQQLRVAINVVTGDMDKAVEVAGRSIDGIQRLVTGAPTLEDALLSRNGGLEARERADALFEFIKRRREIAVEEAKRAANALVEFGRTTFDPNIQSPIDANRRSVEAVIEEEKARARVAKALDQTRLKLQGAIETQRALNNIAAQEPGARADALVALEAEQALIRKGAEADAERVRQFTELARLQREAANIGRAQESVAALERSAALTESLNALVGLGINQRKIEEAVLMRRNELLAAGSALLPAEEQALRRNLELTQQRQQILQSAASETALRRELMLIQDQNAAATLGRNAREEELAVIAAKNRALQQNREATAEELSLARQLVVARREGAARTRRVEREENLALQVEQTRQLVAAQRLGRRERERRVAAINAEFAARQRLGDLDPAEIASIRQVAEDTERLNQELERINANPLRKLADQARSTGEILREALDGAFSSATNSLEEFIRTGKISFSGFVDSIIADIARIAAQQVTSQIAGAALSAGTAAFGGGGGGFFGNLFGGGGGAAASSGAGNTVGDLLHNGGRAGFGQKIVLPSSLFDNAPRFQRGGMADDMPALLQRGERVLNRSETGALAAIERMVSERQDQGSNGDVNINITVPNGDSRDIMQSEGQIRAALGVAVQQSTDRNNLAKTTRR